MAAKTFCILKAVMWPAFGKKKKKKKQGIFFNKIWRQVGEHDIFTLVW